MHILERSAAHRSCQTRNKGGTRRAEHTDLIQAALVGEDGDVAVIAGASCVRVQVLAAGGRRWAELRELATHQT